MADPKRRALGLLIAAATVLGACGPAVTAVSAVASAAPAPTLAPAQATSDASFKSKDPTTLTYLQAGSDPQTLDPAASYQGTGGQIIQNTYDTLIFYNKDKPDQFVPQLATDVPSPANGGISADGKTYIFKIRSGVKFHNGDPLTPDDVAFTFQRGLLQGGINSAQWLLFQPILGDTAGRNNDIADLVDPTGAAAANGDRASLLKADPAKLLAACQSVTSAIVADDEAGTVTFHLAQPWTPFLATLANVWGSVTDKAWIGANGGWDGDCKTWQNYYAPSYGDENKLKLGSGENGTGPYVLDHWNPSQEVVLKAFSGYWRATPAWPGGPAGAPRLQTIVLKTVSQFATRLSVLRAGDADLIDEDSPSDWLQEDPLVGEVCDPASVCALAADPAQPLRAFKGLPALFRADIFFNFSTANTGRNDFLGSGKLDGAGIPPNFFADAHIRKAFNYCFNWDAYIQNFFLGGGAQAFDVMLPGEPGYSDQDPHYSHDPGQCQAEFQASTLKSADGRSLWDTGFRLTIPYDRDNPTRQSVAEILSQDIHAVNPRFSVDTVAMSFTAFDAALTARQLPVFLAYWGEDIHDPHDWLVPYATGTIGKQQSLPGDLVQQLGVYINQGAQEADPARRAAIYKQFNRTYYAAAPGILLAVPSNRLYLQRWVQVYYYNPIYPGYYFYALSKQ